MAKSFDLKTLIWLINSEIATAVYAVKSESDGLELQEIRVRMGQDVGQGTKGEGKAVSLSVDRYPPAEQGWIIDVIYDASKTQSIMRDMEKSEVIPTGWQGVSSKIPVQYLEGVGVKRKSMLQKLGINSLETLANFDIASQKNKDRAIIRRLQSVANLALQLPPIALTSNILKYDVMSLVDKPQLLSANGISKEGEASTYQWLLILEICFNDDWLRRTPLNKMIDLDGSV